MLIKKQLPFESIANNSWDEIFIAKTLFETVAEDSLTSTRFIFYSDELTTSLSISFVLEPVFWHY